MEALRELVHNLPPRLPASVFIVLHTSPHSPCALPAILERAGNLQVTFPEDQEPIRPGRIYVAPPDHHMMIEDKRIRLSKGPKENLTRPAIDPLFRSAALAYRRCVVGVVLTGELDDGTAGLWSVKYRGGTTVVQDPREAAHPSMPQSALKNVHVDYCLPLSEIAPLLVRLANDSVEEGENPVAENLEIENRIALDDPQAIRDVEKLGKLTAFTCPDCHGSLWEVREGEFIRFRCRTGHAYTAETLIAEQEQVIENILRNTLRAAEENAALNSYLAEQARLAGDSPTAERYLSMKGEAEHRGHFIREAILNNEKTASSNHRRTRNFTHRRRPDSDD